MIRRGSTRLVIVIGPLAFKIGRGKRGRRSNRFEADLFARVNDARRAMLCPVLWCTRSGTLLVARSARQLSEVERDELWATDGFPDWDYTSGGESHPFEWKPSDWGWLDGRLVALDYAAPVLFEADIDPR